MRIQEKIEDNATCAKMTEERSMNGGCEVPAVSKRSYVLDGVKSHSLAPADPEGPHAFAGGRLKFYKDGKSILELSYRRDGDRMCWVSNWPVPGAPRHENSTSLSVSDDNSSIQSSPYHRDHSWKQASPRRGRGAHLQFLMRPLNAARRLRRLSFLSRSIRRKRRRPYDSADMNTPLIKEEEMDESLNSSLNSSKSTPSKGKLPSIVQNLLDRVRTNETLRPVIPSGRVDPSSVSPRKRILREFERVSLEEGANSKRQKARISPGNGATSSNNNSTVTCHTLHPAGVPPPAKTATSSYSISSILAPSREEESSTPRDTEPSFLRKLLKSPSSQGGTTEISETSNKSRSVTKTGGGRKMSPTHHQHQMQPAAAASPALSPSPGLRSPAVPSAVGGAAHYAPYLPTPMLYPQFIQHPAAAAAGLPYYSGIPLPQPGPPLWIPYLSSHPRAAYYPGLLPSYHANLSPSPWGQLNHPGHMDDLKKDDGSSDMPLNLSKHAG